jgi:polar amino acid transport system permease protein
MEAGMSLGMTRAQMFRHLILVPALKNVYPALTSQFVLIMLATSVVSQISAPDLFQAGSIIQSRTFRDFEVFSIVGSLYLGLALLLRLVFALLHRVLFRRS